MANAEKAHMEKELVNKPLVEAIQEVKWHLDATPHGTHTDPHYRLLLARLSDRVTDDYPEHEELPAASVPDELAANVVQHRFRVGAGLWPLIQVGPGIFTVNSTADYSWSSFRPRVTTAVKTLYDAHPKVGELQITSLVLRYIDAVNFDFEKKSAFDFLKKLKLHVSLPDSLFSDTGVASKASNLALHWSFACIRPKGFLSLRFARGQNAKGPALVWETIVESAADDLPRMPESFEIWLDDAHNLTHDWFFKLIEGDLERRFSSG